MQISTNENKDLQTAEAKTYTIVLTESELSAITEALSEAVEEAAMKGHNVELLTDMAASHLEKHPGQSKEVTEVIRNYCTINGKLTAQRHELLNVISKAEAVLV